MSLATGVRLGPYEIVAPLGAGGMGEVYRAKDPRIGREVAVKVLPASFSTDPDRLRRFEQEARAAGVLNHPNITAVYDVGTFEGAPYVVTELLDGETLRSRLAGGALAPRRAIDCAIQIAHGLAAAHEKGIVHRDLKPENLFVMKDGRLKILDFGLAKLTQPEKAGPQTSLPTETAGTEPGVVLGTLGYMSPEQVRGRPADSRSDIFSFGAILYEMLSGKRAFHRDTAADTMSAILREDPADLSSTNRQVTPALDRIIRHCLEKNPEARFHSAHDLAFDLEALSGTQAADTQAVPQTSRRPKLMPVLVAVSAIAALLAAAMGFLAGVRSRREPASHPMRFAIPIPPGTVYSRSPLSRAVSISPDGTRLAIEAVSKGRSRLYLRPLDSEEAVELEGSLDATFPFWSPDSRFIAFFAEGKLKKIPATGGPPEELCEAPFALVGTWNREGTILFSRLAPPGIYRVSDKGGQAIRAAAPEPSRYEVNLLSPHFLPDGRRFLYIVNPPQTAQDRELRLGSLDSKESRTVAHMDSRAEYVAPGYLIFVREGALYAQPFDDRKARLHGEPRLLAEAVHYHLGPSNAAFSVSEAGILAYETAAPPSRLVWLDREGREIGQLGQPSVVQGLRISLEGGRVAVDIADRRTGTSDIWLFELSRGVSTRLHFDSVDEILPVWSSDGSKLIYRSDRQGAPDIYEMAIGVPGSEKPLLREPGLQQAEDVSRDGRFLVYLNEMQTTVWAIWLLPLQGDRKPLPWLRTRFNLASPRFSPDGRWIAYESDESGVPEIYMALTEGGGEKRRISPAGGRRPRWRRDGKELYYIAPGGLLMALPVTFGPPLEVGAPVPLLRGEPEIENYDVAPDGSRFLVSTPAEKVRESPIRVIVNWTAALQGQK
ncbi:MAG TPA: protein kinase [Thermoanaerobaculia bacterium]|nr:protein kinase [Thermoanaerobaculia bacterium]